MIGDERVEQSRGREGRGGDTIGADGREYEGR